MSAFQVRIYNTKGEFYADEPAADEAEARRVAIGWTTCKGQTTWTAHVWQQGERVASYRRGEEYKPRSDGGRPARKAQS